jgi:outer membrane protein assembly factor BamA
LEELRKKRENPTANIEIRLRPGHDIDRLKKYYVGHTSVYPDFTSDTIGHPQQVLLYDSSLTIISYRNLFKPKFIADNLFFQRGELYNQKRFFKTIYRFNSLGAWKLVNIEQFPRAGTDSVDFVVYLSPANKYSFTTNIEGSRKSSFFLDERLIGIGINTQLLNRNFGRSSNQATTNLRFGTEVDTKGEFVKTRQASISHSIFFPKPIPNARWIPERFRENFKTVLTFSLGNIERIKLFNLTSLNAAWGYNFNWKSSRGKNKAANLKIPNIEYAFLNPRPDLDTIFMNTPSFRNIFNTGLVVSIQGGYQVRGGKGRGTNIFRTNFEESGLLSNYIKIKALDSLFRFVKLDAEFIRNINFGKTSFLFRTYAGAGFAMETRTRKTNFNLPFFKQFYAGGPNSMRAWRLRTLGPGSTVKAIDSVPFRFGDFQFETNAEFRFPLARIGGYQLSSCLFTDIGNVWFLKSNPDFPDGTLTAKNFLADLAVGLGTGLRFDFNFFLLRLDYAIILKNPTPEPVDIAGRNKWFYNFKPLGGIIQLGINYPFSF